MTNKTIIEKIALLPECLRGSYEHFLGTREAEAISLHTHTGDSRKDANAPVAEIMKAALAMGAKKLAITDHGVLTGIETAKDAAKATGIELIPGTEAYYRKVIDASADVTHRDHLVLLARDETGYKAISLAVTASNTNIDSSGFPLMTDEILDKYFAEGSIGHGHVIAMSACQSGVLASILLMNNAVQKEIDKTKKLLANLYSPEDEAYLSAKAEALAIEASIQKYDNEIADLTSIAKRKFGNKERALKAFVGTDEYDAKKRALDVEKAESEDAAQAIASVKAQRANAKLRLTDLNITIKLVEGTNLERWKAYNAKIDALRDDIRDDAQLYEMAKNEAIRFAKIFGEGNFFCELQYHGLEDEQKVMPIIAEIADELGLPLVATNDAHIISKTDDEIRARQIIRSMRFNKWEEVTESEKECYLKTGDELRESLLKILPDDVVERAMAGIGVVAERCHVVFENAHHYPKYPSETGEDATVILRRLATEGIAKKYPGEGEWTTTHAERLEYELDVITKLGFCDYLCIVADFLNYGRLLGRINLNDPRYLADPYNIEMLEKIASEDVGLGVGPGRGSAVGSLVCYLTGITSIDPMKYNLLFERFLNVERVSMPDIDSDFKTDIRGKVLDYVKHKYGEDAVCCIMTRGTQAAKASIRNVARLRGSEVHGDPKYYLELGGRMAKAVPKGVGVSLESCKDIFEEQFGDDEEAMAIFRDALLVEGAFINVGMHAAGVIIADNGDVKQYVPLMWNSDKEQWVTQCEKDHCEALGLLKMDFLGLRNLNIITETLRRIKRNTGKSIDIEKIPFEPAVFENIFSTGNTNSVFQFESNGMKSMLRQFKPETIEDVILLVAAYRPGPMQFLEQVIAVKHGREKPKYIIPAMEEILGPTYGSPIYQEQIQQIFNKFAGFTLGEADIIRRYMSKKQTAKFAAYKDKFINGLLANGAKERDALDFWEQMVKFSEYAFNKSHAAAYAIVAYYTAWLKHYYPAEYICSVMNDTELEKFAGLMADCKGLGVKVYPANINVSEAEFATGENGIVVGLGLVKGVASAATAIIENRAGGRYKSFADFVLRARVDKGVAESLVYAGAFDEFTKNRQALVNAIPEYYDIFSKIKKKEEIVAEPIPDSDDTAIEKAKARRQRAQDALDILLKNLNDISVNSMMEEDVQERLTKEKEFIGAFISGHPLDVYGTPANYRCANICDISGGQKVSVMGAITNLRITHRKRDGAPMAFFTLEDQSGTVDVNCFVDKYSQFKDLIKKDAVVIIEGSCIEDIDEFNDTEALKVNVASVKQVHIKTKFIVLRVNSLMEWADSIRDRVKPFRDTSGMELIVYDAMTGSYRRTTIRVNTQILEVPEIETKVIVQ